MIFIGWYLNTSSNFLPGPPSSRYLKDFKKIVFKKNYWLIGLFKKLEKACSGLIFREERVRRFFHISQEPNTIAEGKSKEQLDITD